MCKHHSYQPQQQGNISEETLSLMERGYEHSQAAYIPNIAPRKRKGIQPENCGDPVKDIKPMSSRQAYVAAAWHIEQDPVHNCSTIEANNRVKFWKAIALPVELERVEDVVTFLYSEELHLEEPR